MTVRFAKKLEDIQPFQVMELMERAKALENAGHRVVHFEVGEPDFVTAQPILDAAKAALDDGRTKYTQALGLPELRQSIAGLYADRCSLDIAPDRVVVTSGASGGLLLLAALLLDPGDTVLLPDPGYPCNEAFLHLVGARARRIPVFAAENFQLDPAALETHWDDGCRGLLVASPANPTGAVMTDERLLGLYRWVKARGGVTILDEIYQGLDYRTEGYHSGLMAADDLWIVNSFSKYFGMTGWRLGWLVLPEGVSAEIAKLSQNLFISPSSIAQYAALAAFSPAAVAIHEQRRQEFSRRRDTLLDGLQDIGFRVPVPPDGAFYVYADISGFGLTAQEFCWRLVNEYHVAVTPGDDFGSNLADRYVRFAYTTDMDSIDIGLQRIGRAVSSWAG